MGILTPEKKAKLKDKKWRLNHLYKIINKDGDLVTFKCNYEQNKLFDQYQIKREGIGLREYILKDRQIGITTFHVLYYLDEVIFNRNRTAAIIAHEREALEKIFRKASTALENLPPYLMPHTKIENKRELTFAELNSSIYIALKVRSGTIHHLHVSEIAYIREYKELKAGSFSTVPMMGDITCESTGNGLNEFYNDWNENKVSKIWRNNFFSWMEHDAYVSNIKQDKTLHDEYLGDVPENRRNWWYLKLEELGRDFHLMKQEYPLNEEDAFLHSGKGLFQDELIGMEVMEPIRIEEWMSIYVEPENGEEYCIGADSSIGHKDGDASCFYVMNSRTWEIVAMWHGRIAPDLYGNEIVKWSEFYNMAFVGIEENNCGLAVINTVKETYSNLYQRERRDKVTEEVTTQLGWYTTDKSKDEIIAMLKQTLRDKVTPCIPEPLKDELNTFVIKENGKREALNGMHDDHVMAWGITLMMIKHNPYYELTNKPPTYMGRETLYNRR
jgi:hypothetical protein